MIERLRWWQIDELLDIEADLFGAEKWSAAMFWGELARDGHYRVAREAGRIVGYAGLAIGGPDEMWLQNLAVRRDRQRRGVGEALLRDLLAEADRRGARTVVLEVAVNNDAAKALYRRHGFTPVGIRRGYYQPSNTDAVTMVRERPPEAGPQTGPQTGPENMPETGSQTGPADGPENSEVGT